MNRIPTIAKRLTLLLLKFFQWSVVLILFFWSVGALYHFVPFPRWLSVSLSSSYLAAAVYWFFRIQSRSIWLQRIAATVVAIYLLTLIQQPSNSRDWAPDNAVMPSVTVSGNDVHIKGFRHNLYRSESDFDVQYRDFDFSLPQLDQVWFVVQRFTALEGIAHNFLTFRVTTEDGPQYFSVSVEIRREQGEAFSPVRGLYRQYELIYVIADERDQIGTRTVFRPADRVFMYPVNATLEQVQALFLDIVARVQKLREYPEFYHSLANNCTNNIVDHAYKFTPLPISSLDPRILAPGFADRLGFAKGLIGDNGESFDAMQQRCRIDKIARRVGITDRFSTDIRAP